MSNPIGLVITFWILLSVASKWRASAFLHASPKSVSKRRHCNKSFYGALKATRPRGRRKQSSSPDRGFGSTSSSPPIIATEDDATAVSGNEKAQQQLSPSEKRHIYSLPALYDMAFGYRNFEEEVAFLIGQHQLLHEGTPPNRILEIAAGPARHSIYALQSAYTKYATAMDLSSEMVEYGKDIAGQELSAATNSDGDRLLDSFNYVEADMRSFDVDGLHDSAWILLGSLQHLTTNEEVISCFESIHKALSPEGTLIIELPHPRETFSLVECTRNGWEVPLEDENGREYGELEIVWGDDDDAFDPIRQVRQFTVSMELKLDSEGIEGGKAGRENRDELQSVREVVPLRHFTAQEINALARIAGFKVSSFHGALAENVDVNDEEEAFRLVCVLQKL